MEWMGSCDGTSEYPSVCDATDGYVRCDDAGEVVRSKLFLGHFERHRTPEFGTPRDAYSDLDPLYTAHSHSLITHKNDIHHYCIKP